MHLLLRHLLILWQWDALRHVGCLHRRLLLLGLLLRLRWLLGLLLLLLRHLLLLLRLLLRLRLLGQLEPTADNLHLNIAVALRAGERLGHALGAGSAALTQAARRLHAVNATLHLLD